MRERMEVADVHGGSTVALSLSDLGAEAGTVVRVILVVDDDDPVRVMLARLLRTQGYSVLQAANAAEARKLLEADEPPDLIISDIVMPGESGMEFRRYVSELWPDLPVILVSGYSAEGPAEFAAKTANTMFVQKPFAADQLLTLVERTLAGHRQLGL